MLPCVSRTTEPMTLMLGEVRLPTQSAVGRLRPLRALAPLITERLITLCGVEHITALLTCSQEVSLTHPPQPLTYCGSWDANESCDGVHREATHLT